jgi:hypothetical protein
MIADAVKAGKRVAVICQKEAALEVVEKRLKAAGLGDLTARINDVEKDRARVIKGIRGISEDFSLAAHVSDGRDREVKTIHREEKLLDRISIELSRPIDGDCCRYADIRSRIHGASSKNNPRAHPKASGGSPMV